MPIDVVSSAATTTPTSSTRSAANSAAPMPTAIPHHAYRPE
ncbi:MAG: hypothetical protein ACRDRH_19070 [Pseudonocardia sp.]